MVFPAPSPFCCPLARSGWAACDWPIRAFHHPAETAGWPSFLTIATLAIGGGGGATFGVVWFSPD